jgi:HlyD family secretion protein
LFQKVKKRKKALLAAGILILLALAVAVNLARGRGEALIPVRAAGVEYREIEDVVYATGRIRLVEKQEVYADDDATVKKIYVRPGDQVAKGQLLISLDGGEYADSELAEARANFQLQEANYRKAIAALPLEARRLKAAVDSAEAALAAAQSQYDRYKILYEQGAVSAQDFESVEIEYKHKQAELTTASANYEARQSGSIPEDEVRSLEGQLGVARAQFDRAQEKYDHFNVKADTDGIVFTVEVTEGEAVAPRTKLLTIGKPDRMEIEVNVSEGDSSKIMPGQRAEIAVSALPDQKFAGKVEYASAGAVLRQNEQGGKSLEVPVLISIEGDVTGMRPGYNADVNIICTDKKKALTVPYEAVVNRDGKKYVFVVGDKKARQAEIKGGLNTELYTEVLEGIQEGDRVIVNPEEKIKDGVGVKELPQQEGAGREDKQE